MQKIASGGDMGPQFPDSWVTFPVSVSNYPVGLWGVKKETA